MQRKIASVVVFAAACGGAAASKAPSKECSFEALEAFDPGTRVVNRQFKRTLQGATLSRRQRIIETRCEPEDDDESCRERGARDISERFPEAQTLGVEIESPSEGEPKRAYTELLLDPGLKSVVEELRMTLVLGGAGPEITRRLQRRASASGLTVSSVAMDGGQTTAILSCSKYQKNIAPD